MNKCKKCNNTKIVKNGFCNGKQYWKCKCCGHVGTLECDCRHGTKLNYKMSKRQLEIFLGLMLGDGSIQHNSLVVGRSSNDIRYNNYLMNEFADICKSNMVIDKYTESYITEHGIKRKICRTSCSFVTLVTNQLMLFRKSWYRKNRNKKRNRKFNKVIPIDFVSSIFCARSLAIWYLDDGNIEIGNSNRIKLYTNDFTKKEVIFLKNLLNSIGLGFSVMNDDVKYNRGYILAMFGKENILKFSKIVNRYIKFDMGMSEDRVSGVNKTPWRNTYIMRYLKNKIKLRELKDKGVI